MDASINSLLTLEEDWDSYGASPVKLEFASTAIDLLQSVMHPNTPPPAIVPTAIGGIQIEWHTNGMDLEIEVESTSRINVWFDDSRSDVTWEAEFTSDLQRLTSAIAMLSREKYHRI